MLIHQTTQSHLSKNLIPFVYICELLDNLKIFQVNLYISITKIKDFQTISVCIISFQTIPYKIMT